MQEAIIILSLLGCDHEERNCNFIDTVSAHYETVAECESDAGRALLSKADANYPVVMAKCEMKAPLMLVEERAISQPPNSAVAVAMPQAEQSDWFVVRRLNQAVDYATPVAAKAGEWLSDGYSATGHLASVAWAKLPMTD